MQAKPSTRETFEFFRMGLATGMVELPAVIRWADNEIMTAEVPDPQIIDLALSTPPTYSQMLWLLNSFQVRADYGLPLNLLFARAGIILAHEPQRAAWILRGLRLLMAEAQLPQPVMSCLAGLDSGLELFEQEQITAEELHARLASFLEPYRVYQGLLETML